MKGRYGGASTEAARAAEGHRGHRRRGRDRLWRRLPRCGRQGRRQGRGARRPLHARFARAEARARRFGTQEGRHRRPLHGAHLVGRAGERALGPESPVERQRRCRPVHHRGDHGHQLRPVHDGRPGLRQRPALDGHRLRRRPRDGRRHHVVLLLRAVGPDVAGRAVRALLPAPQAPLRHDRRAAGRDRRGLPQARVHESQRGDAEAADHRGLHEGAVCGRAAAPLRLLPHQRRRGCHHRAPCRHGEGVSSRSPSW